MSVLVCLAESPGQPISKQQLLQTVWPDTFIGEAVLARSIVELRRVFEDDAKNARVIQTIAKRGYRLLAPVTPVKNTAQLTPSNGTPAAEFQTRPGLRNRTLGLAILSSVGVAVLLLAILGFSPDKWGHRRWNKTQVPAIQSLAVLPLQNLSGDASQEYFSDGMTEELITELSHIRGLKVISRTSIMRYKMTDKSLIQIARELNVDGIVEGSVVRSGDRVRITAQLIDAQTDTNLWAEAYDRDIRDVLELQANVASKVAAELNSQINRNAGGGRSHPYSVNLAALDAYLKGQYHEQQYGSGGSPDERYKAAEYFRQATQIDPGFARAWVGLAVSYITNVAPSTKETPIFKEAVEKALLADANLSDAHYWMARFKEYHDWDFAAAGQEFRRAIELDPNNAVAHEWYGDYLDNMSRWSEAYNEQQLAQTLDPNNDHLVDGFYNRGNYERALGIARNLVELHPENGWNHWTLSRIYFALGRYEEGIAELQPALRQYGYPEMASALAKAYAASGYKAALRLYAKDLAKMQGNPACPTMVASVYVLMRDKDEAFKWLEKGFAERDGFLVGLNLPEFQSLRGDARFYNLVRRVGLPQ